MQWLFDSDLAKAIGLIAGLITIGGCAIAFARWFGWRISITRGDPARLPSEPRKCAFCDGIGKMEGDWRLQAASAGSQVDIVPCSVCGGRGTLDEE